MSEERQLHPGEKLFTFFLLLFSIFVLVMAYRISGFSSVSSPGMFPMFAAAVMVGSMATLVLKNRKRIIPDVSGFTDEMKKAVKEVFPPVFIIYSLIILTYMIILQPFHFLPSSFLFLLGSIIYLKGSSPVKSILISIGLLTGVYLIFHYLFQVVLP